MQREESQEIVAVKNKSLKSVTEEQLQAEILVFSVHTVNVNAAKTGKVLDNLSVNIYVYIFLFFFLSSGRNLRNITCLLFPLHDCAAELVVFFFF